MYGFLLRCRCLSKSVSIHVSMYGTNVPMHKSQQTVPRVGTPKRRLTLPSADRHSQAQVGSTLKRLKRNSGARRWTGCNTATVAVEHRTGCATPQMCVSWPRAVRDRSQSRAHQRGHARTRKFRTLANHSSDPLDVNAHAAPNAVARLQNPTEISQKNWCKTWCLTRVSLIRTCIANWHVYR